MQTDRRTAGRSAGHHFCRKERFSGDLIPTATILTKCGFSRQIFIKSPTSYITVIRPVGASLILADRRTNGPNEGNMRFLRLCERAQKRSAREVNDETRFITEKEIRSKKQFSTSFYKTRASSIKIIPREVRQATTTMLLFSEERR
jgi:hypothetical protein